MGADRGTSGERLPGRPVSRYGAGGIPDYSHRYHAGNVGDVWKHCVLLEVLGRLAAGRGRITYLETHAGEGRYPLGPTGEWTGGVGRLWAGEAASAPLAGYLALCRRLAGGGDRPRSYPGSPLLAAAALGPEAGLELWERDPGASERLARVLEGRQRTRVVTGDGLGAFEEAVRAAGVAAGTVAALVDPPWTEREDWQRVPRVVLAGIRALPAACLLLWYPVKSLTRPNAMMATLAREGLAGTLAELVTLPFEHRRTRLNGSGVLLVNPPPGALEAIAGAAPEIAARCAVLGGVWSFRMRSFAGPC